MSAGKAAHLLRAVTRRVDLLPNLLILLIGLFYLAHLKGGHDWGGDFSMYIMNARNIVSGVPYAETKYLYNPDMAVVGPRAYPPVFPLMLAPVIAARGVNLRLLKLVGVACLILLLLFLNARTLPRSLSKVLRITYLVLVGLFPPLFVQADSILSDIPFLLFCAVAIERIDDHTRVSERIPAGPAGGLRVDWFQVVLTGVILYAAYGLRTVGIILIPVLLCVDVARNKRIAVSTMGIGLVAAALIALQAVLIPATGNYLDQFAKPAGEILSMLGGNAERYNFVFYSFFPFDNQVLQRVVFWLGLGLTLVGLATRLRNGVSAIPVFFLFYLVFILAWPAYQGVRFLFPVFLFYMLFLLEGFQIVLTPLRKWKTWLPTAVSLVLLVGVAYSYANMYTWLVPRPKNALEMPDTKELFNFVRSETSDTETIAFFKPRVLALFTDRWATSVAVPNPKMDAMERMEEIGVDYMIVRLNYKEDGQPEWVNLVETNPENFRLVYENPTFRVYRFKDGGMP